jgi:hypothetical protein
MAQGVEYLPCKHKALSLNHSNIKKKSFLLHICYMPGSLPNLGNIEMKSTTKVPTMVNLEWNRD